MTYQLQAIQGISDSIGGSASMDQILGGVAFAVLILGYVSYVIYLYFTHDNSTPFNSLH